MALLTRQSSGSAERRDFSEVGSGDLVLQSVMHVRIAENVIEDGPNRNGCRVRAGNEVHEHVAKNDAIVDGVRMGLFGVEKVLQEIRHLGVKILVVTLASCYQVFQCALCHSVQVGWADTHHWILVEDEIQKRHLSDGGKTKGTSSSATMESRQKSFIVVDILVKCLVCKLNAAIIIVALVHVAKSLAHGCNANQVPSILELT